MITGLGLPLFSFEQGVAIFGDECVSDDGNGNRPEVEDRVRVKSGEKRRELEGFEETGSREPAYGQQTSPKVFVTWGGKEEEVQYRRKCE